MVPMIVLVVVTLIARTRVPWKDAVRIGMAALLLFTASAHFNAMKHDLAAMIPPPLTGSLWLIYLTGMLEISGAVGLLIPRFRKPAALCPCCCLSRCFPLMSTPRSTAPRCGAGRDDALAPHADADHLDRSAVVVDDSGACGATEARARVTMRRWLIGTLAGAVTVFVWGAISHMVLFTGIGCTRMPGDERNRVDASRLARS